MKQLLLWVPILCSLLMLGVPVATYAGCGEKTVQRTYQTVNGECTEEREECNGKTTLTSCCICSRTVSDRGVPQTLREMVGDSGYTFSSCEELCKKNSGDLYRQAGAGALPADRAAPALAQVQEQLKYCFKAADCASKEYGGSMSAFRPGHSCPSGQGRCVAPEPELKLSFPIGNIQTVAGFRGFVATVFNYATGIAAVAAAVMFVWGGMRYIFGSAFQNIKRAKEIMVDASVGLVLTLAAMVILRAINPATLDLSKLEVFMINKEQFLNQEFCEEVTDPSGADDFKFADAGPAPAFTPINQVPDAQFSIKKADTKCNYQYYIKGFGESRCKGRKCDEPGSVCVPCTAGYCGQSSGFVCESTTIAGTITYEGDRKVKVIKLMAMCGFIATTGIDQNVLHAGYRGWIFPIAEGKITDGGPSRQGYSVKVTKEKIAEAQKQCESRNGLFGYSLVMQYNDPFILPTKLDDYAVIGENNCNTAGTRFAAYLNGGPVDLDGELAIAAACAKAVGNPNYFWLDKKIATAVDENKPIQCDIALNAVNAPGDPGGDLSMANDGKHVVLSIQGIVGSSGAFLCAKP